MIKSVMCFIHILTNRELKTIEMDNGIHIHIDPFNNKVVGFTIQDYNKRYVRGMIKKVPYFDCELPKPELCEKLI